MATTPAFPCYPDFPRPTWRTLVLSASKEAVLPPAALWETWGALQDWPAWSAPLHVDAGWAGPPGWEAGALFKQVLNLGFPFGIVTSVERVHAVEKGRAVAWHATDGRFSAYQMWRFEALPGARTRISSEAAVHGTLVGLLKPFVARRWQRLLQSSLDGLIRRVRRETLLRRSDPCDPT